MKKAASKTRRTTTTATATAPTIKTANTGDRYWVIDGQCLVFDSLVEMQRWAEKEDVSLADYQITRGVGVKFRTLLVEDTDTATITQRSTTRTTARPSTKRGGYTCKAAGCTHSASARFQFLCTDHRNLMTATPTKRTRKATHHNVANGAIQPTATA